MPDLLAFAQRVVQIAISAGETALLAWALKDGIIYIIRTFEFMLDIKIVSFAARLYSYFLQILNGTMFNENVVQQIVKNIYVFIGVIVFFRLMMLIVKYLVNPDLVSDAKVGANALIQRCIIGMAGILFIPTIFDLGLRLQDAILEDNIIQQLIIPSDMLKGMEDKIQNGGKYIGTYVLSGFVSPASNASSATKSAYDSALARGDLSSINVNEGGFLGTGTYQYEYFIFFSTFALCYVLYVMIKYCIDLAVRAFKLLIYQVLAPVAMVEYMIEGSENGVFKNWKTAVLSTYFMLFVRVMALWFVMFVTSLMSGDYTNYTNGSLLASDDYLLRAIIIIALLGFMMDLPKLIGQIFGLDLEQESSANGILKQVGGMFKSAAMGGLAVGGAAFGAISNINKSLGDATNKGIANAFNSRAKNAPNSLASKLQSGYNKAKTGLNNSALGKTAGNIKSHLKGSTAGQYLGAIGQAAKEDKVGSRISKGLSNVGAQVMQSTGVTKAAYSGYSSANSVNKGVSDKIEAEQEKAATAQMRSDIKSLKDSNETMKADVEAALHVTDRDANGMAVDAEIKVSGSGGGAGSGLQDKGMNPELGAQEGGSSSVQGDKRSRFEQAMFGATAEVTTTISQQIDSHTSVVQQSEQTRQIVQSQAVKVANEVFGGTVQENAHDIRQTMDEQGGASAVMPMKTAFSRVIATASDKLGLEGGHETPQFEARMAVELMDMDVIGRPGNWESLNQDQKEAAASAYLQAHQDALSDDKSISYETLMRATEGAVSKFHTDVEKAAAKELESKAKPRVNNGRNTLNG